MSGKKKIEREGEIPDVMPMPADRSKGSVHVKMGDVSLKEDKKPSLEIGDVELSPTRDLARRAASNRNKPSQGIYRKRQPAAAEVVSEETSHDLSADSPTDEQFAWNDEHVGRRAAVHDKASEEAEEGDGDPDTDRKHASKFRRILKIIGE